ncbi:PRAME member 17, partial [Saguinus oedipus]
MCSQQQFIPDLETPILCLDYPEMLFVTKVNNIKEHLDHLLRCFKNTLEALTLHKAYLADRDMEYLSPHPSLSQLKQLDL